jgi:PAS domain S-box-containing protein
METLKKSGQLILIVDDVPKNIQVIGTILREKGFLVSIAQSGSQALNTVEQSRPDLILLDILMPGMDGFETCRCLKKNSATKDIPVIFLSALSDPIDKVKGLNIGAVDYVTKPIDSEELLARINTHLTIQSLRCELEDINVTLEEKVRLRTQELARKNEALQESERQFRTLVANIPGVIYRGALDPDWTMQFMSDFIQEVSGYPSSDFVQHRVRTYNSIIHPDDREMVKKIIQEAVQQMRPFAIEYRILHADGGQRWVYEKGQGVPGKNGEILWLDGAVFDITERKRAEEGLQQLRNLLSSIINSMPSVLVGVDLEGKVTQWNREAEKATGVSPETAQGQSLADVFPRLTNEIQKVRKAVMNRKPLKETKVPTRVNGDMKFSDITVYPLMGIGVEGAVIRIDDVTERVRIEETMIQTEKMMSVGGLAAGMAHEINNPLSGMLQAAQNVLRRTSPELEQNVQAACECGTDLEAICMFLEKRGIFRFLEDIRASGVRASRIVANMLQFSRPSESRKVTVNLPRLMDRTVELASSDYDLKKQYDFRHIEIVREYNPILPEVPCVEMEISQVLLNLLKNAAEAMGGQKERAKNSRIILRARLVDTMIRIEVEDNGPGMSEMVRKRVFEPFFTTKEVGKGTGLGLSVSYFIITNNHQGTMSVESVEGKGTRFIIELPIKSKAL